MPKNDTMNNAIDRGAHGRLVPPSTPAHQAILNQRRESLSRDLAPILQDRRGIVWEVGCGHGHFLTAYANAHPESLCIGIDIASERIDRAVRKRDRARLRRLHFIRAEARLFLEVLPPEIRFTQVFILFPDPWPKLRHHKHRVMQTEFLAWIAARMSPDGRLYFRTDHEPYFNETARLLAEHPQWTRTDDPWPFEHETVFQSRAASHHSLVARAKPAAIS